jgi:hypothetical protein
VHCKAVSRHVLEEQSTRHLDQWLGWEKECQDTCCIVIDVWVLEDLGGYLCTREVVLSRNITYVCD